MTFLGITVTEEDRESRLVATMLITLFENVPQFLVVTYEIFAFGFSVNFIQAANPIFTVFMIYKSMGRYLGEWLYKDGFGGMVLFFSFMVMPQLILSVYMIRNMYSVPQSLIEANMFNPKELQSGSVSKNMVIPIIISIALVSIGGGYLYAKKHAKKIR